MTLNKLDRVAVWHKEVNIAHVRHFMNMVTRLEQYLAAIDLPVIKADVLDTQKTPSSAYQHIQKQAMLSKSILLFTKLITDESMALLSKDNEQRILKSLQSNCASLFLNYKSEPQKHCNEILGAWADFLDIDPGSFSNKVQAKNLYMAFYLAMSYALRCLRKCPWGLKQFANYWRINIEDYINTLEGFIARLEVRMKEVKALLSSPVQPKAHSSAFDVAARNETDHLILEAQQLIQEHLNEQYMQQFKGDSPLGAQVSQVLQKMQDVTTSLKRYCTYRTERDKLICTISKQQELLNALNDNDARYRGWVCFLDLIGQHDAAYDELIEGSSSKEKQELVLNVAAQERAAVSWNESLFWSIAAQLVDFSKSVGHALTPHAVQARLPDSLNSRATYLLKHLSSERLSSLMTQLDALNKDMNEVFADQRLSELLKTASVDVVDLVIKANDLDSSKLSALLTPKKSDDSVCEQVNTDFLDPQSNIGRQVLLLMQYKAQLQRLYVLDDELNEIVALIETDSPNEVLQSLMRKQRALYRSMYSNTESQANKLQARLENICLKEINKCMNYLNQFIIDHHAWWVIVTDFLAHFFSIFKTEAGRQIDRAKALNQRLDACKEECQTCDYGPDYWKNYTHFLSEVSLFRQQEQSVAVDACVVPQDSLGVSLS